MNELKANGIIFTKDPDGVIIKTESRKIVGENYAFGFVDKEILLKWLSEE